jgi:hypothetical protein
VRIPGGDLAPARRRRHGGSYGRRRQRRGLRYTLVVLLLAAAGGGAYLLQRDDSKVPQRLATTPKSCPTTAVPAKTPAQPVALPAPKQVRLMLLNGTPRNGLAKTVADQLAAAGFVVTGQGNAPAALRGASTVTFGSGGSLAGTLVSHWVLGSRLVGNPKAAPGTVQVVLGSTFRRLATPAEAAAAAKAATRQPAGPGVPVPSPVAC